MHRYSLTEIGLKHHALLLEIIVVIIATYFAFLIFLNSLLQRIITL